MLNRSLRETDQQRLNRICSILSIGVKRLIDAKNLAEAIKNSTAVKSSVNEDME